MDENYKLFNEILLKNKSIEKIEINRMIFCNKKKKGNNLTFNRLINMKESLIKNQNIKEIHFPGKLNVRLKK
jgi:hypothetical protein